LRHAGPAFTLYVGAIATKLREHLNDSEPAGRIHLDPATEPTG